MSKRIHVMVAVISDAAGNILISKRPDHVHLGGLWEFPGGKVDSGETPEVALNRELKEELDIVVQSSKPFLEISHDYSERSVFLDIRYIEEFSGVAKGNEGQDIKWVAREELSEFNFPEANLPIINKLKAETTC